MVQCLRAQFRVDSAAGREAGMYVRPPAASTRFSLCDGVPFPEQGSQIDTPRTAQYHTRRMSAIVLFACAWVLGSCAFPFFRSKPPVVPPPRLTVEFDSVSAAAELAWDASPQQGFLQYRIQRSRAGRDFETIALIAGRLDTTRRDSGLLANTTYRYRVVVERIGKPGDDGDDPSVASKPAKGGIHRLLNS